MARWQDAAPILLPPVVWGADLVAEEDPERNWLIPGLFERGDRLIVTGNEGEGKSTWMRQLALQLSSGIHPFTLKPIPPLRVFLMDLENSRQQTKKKLVEQAHRAEIAVPGEPWLAIGSWPGGLNLTSFDYEAALKATLTEIQPDIVIGGPLYKMTETSLSDETVSRQLSAALDRLRAEFDMGLILEAHQINEATAYDNHEHKFVRNRQTRPFGSSLWRRWPEFGICLFKDGTLYHWRGQRDEREWIEKLQRDGEVWMWQPDNHLCPICGEPRPDGRELYCSDKCKRTAQKRRERAKGQTELL